MKTDRYQIKLYASAAVPAHDLIAVFHGWIRDRRLGDELVIDVADYTHVHHGPGVVLLGHLEDYYYDLGEGRPGLLYSRKRGFDGTAGDGVRAGLAKALDVGRKLQEDTAGLALDTGELLIRFPDKLHAPNSDASFEAARGDVAAALTEAFGQAPATLAREGHAQAPLTIRATWSGSRPLA